VNEFHASININAFHQAFNIAYKGVRQPSRFLTTALQKAVKTCQIEEKSRGRYTIHVDQDKRET